MTELELCESAKRAQRYVLDRWMRLARSRLARLKRAEAKIKQLESDLNSLKIKREG